MRLLQDTVTRPLIRSSVRESIRDSRKINVRKSLGKSTMDAVWIPVLNSVGYSFKQSVRHWNKKYEDG